MADLTKLPLPSAVPTAAPSRKEDAIHARFGTAGVADRDPAMGKTAVDFAAWPDFSDLYSKGLQQDHPGIVNAGVFEAFLAACAFTDPAAPKAEGVQPADFENPAIVRGGTAKLNGPRGAFALQPIGDDSQAFGTPPVAAPPRPDSAAYAVEQIELYWASLLRDVAFTEFEALPPTTPHGALVHAASEELTAHAALYAGPKAANVVTPRLLFRGGFHGETVGPYLSQFCIQPT
jgi:hypothetical protein